MLSDSAGESVWTDSWSVHCQCSKLNTQFNNMSVDSGNLMCIIPLVIFSTNYSRMRTMGVWPILVIFNWI